MPTEVPWLQLHNQRLRSAVGVDALICGLVTVFAALAFFASFIWPSGVAPETTVYAGRVDDFEVDVPVYFEQKFFLVRRPGDVFIALYAVNPHNTPNECPVVWAADREWSEPATGAPRVGAFHAPCHGESFEITGRRIFGPSPRDLDRFPVVVDGDRVYVEAGKQDLIRGKYSPVGALPTRGPAE